MRLVIASNNKNKVREIKEILGDRFDAVIPMREAGIELDVVEDADSFMGNARKRLLKPLRCSPMMRCSRTIPVSALMHSAARPGCIPHAMPAKVMTMRQTAKSFLKR